MDNTIVQAGSWLGMGVLLFMYLKRRRTRKLSE